MAKNYVDVPGTDEEGFDQEALRGMLQLELEDAAEYVESELGVRRAEATERYRGEPYGDEEDGRSAIVDRTIRDTIMQIIPSLIRIFAGPKQVVEFEPERPNAEELAKQRTDYINMVFYRDNPGFLTLHGWIKDALIRNYGVVKVWWDDKVEVTNESYTGLLEEQVLELSDDPSVTDFAAQVEDGEGVEMPEDDLAEEPQVGPDGQPLPPQRLKTHSVTLRREKPAGRLRVGLVPGEEFLIDRNATCLDDAKIVAHRRGVTRSDLVAMGYDREFLAEHEGVGAFSFESSPEAVARHPEGSRLTDEDTVNDDLKETLYTEVWVAVDTDGDDIAELHKICLIGHEFFIARMEPATEIPFAILTPDPEPHEFGGTGYHDLLEDIQRISTSVLRASLDSLAQAIIPRLGVVEGNVNMLDVLNTEVGAVIRMKAPGGIEPVVTPFVGAAGLQMLEFFRGKVEERGGITRTSQGLDADALQSTTRAAVAAQMSAAQQRIELIARVMAETGIKDLFRLMQKFVMRHQDVERTVRLRGKWVTVDPRTWDAELDVRINVGMGSGPPEERIGRLLEIAAKQEQLLDRMGPTPIVTFDRYRNTLAKLVETGGEDDPDSFFGHVPPGWAPEPPEPTPDPAMILAEAQAKETEAKIQIEQMKAQTAQQEMLLKDQQERAKIAANVYIEMAKIEASTGTQVSEQHITAAIEMARMQQGAQHAQ